MSPTDNRDSTDETNPEDKRSQLEVARIREDEKIADHWRRVADSLTEPAREQLLDDLRDWDAAAWQHRLHPTRSTGTTSEAARPSKGDGENDA
jgi:hypothetical protein